MNRLLIVGLDGATFDLIGPWVQEGKLPNLGKLLESGAQGALKSTIPPMSPPAWTSFMTGKNPGKHGVFDFTARKPFSYEIEFVNARWRKAETIWKIMSDVGKRICVLSVPITYPPEKVNGVMISGIDSPGVTGGIADPTAVHPPELHAEIFKAVGPYLISPNIVAFENHQWEEMATVTLQTVERKMDTALYLLAKEPWDCFMITIGETDGIAHRMWKYHDKRSPLANEHSSQYQGPDPILCIYQKVDQYIGKLCAMASDDTTIMVMSDHGHGGNGVKVIYLNRWLEGLGLLKFKPASNRTWFTSLMNMAKKAGLKFLPPTFKKKIFRRTNLANKMESYLRFSSINWSYTKAYSEETPYYPNIWINMEGREPSGIIKPGKEYEEIRQDIIDALYKWVDPDTGQQIIRKIHKREELYSGPFVEKFPDLIIEWDLDNGYSYLFKNSYESKGAQIAIRRVNEDEKDKLKSGDHRDYGLLIASGEIIQKQTELRGAEIIDLAPTILYLLGLLIPADMDGKVLTQLFSDEQLATHPVRYRDGSRPDGSLPEPPQDYSEAEEEAVRARLQGLGYVE